MKNIKLKILWFLKLINACKNTPPNKIDNKLSIITNFEFVLKSFDIIKKLEKVKRNKEIIKVSTIINHLSLSSFIKQTNLAEFTPTPTIEAQSVAHATYPGPTAIVGKQPAIQQTMPIAWNLENAHF